VKSAPLTNRLLEKQIRFLVNGVLSDGEIDTTNAEQAFYKVVRFSRKFLLDEERAFIAEGLTVAQLPK